MYNTLYLKHHKSNTTPHQLYTTHHTSNTIPHIKHHASNSTQHTSHTSHSHHTHTHTTHHTHITLTPHITHTHHTHTTHHTHITLTSHSHHTHTHTSHSHHTHITLTHHTQVHLGQTHWCPVAHTPLGFKVAARHIDQLLTTRILTLGGRAKGVTYVQVNNIPPRLYPADDSSVANAKITLWVALQRGRGHTTNSIQWK